MGYSPPTIRQIGLDNWINDGQAKGKWVHSARDFHYYRDELKLSRRKMAELFGRPEQPNVPARPLSQSRMAEWWAIDDEEKSNHETH